MPESRYVDEGDFAIDSLDLDPLSVEEAQKILDRLEEEEKEEEEKEGK